MKRKLALILALLLIACAALPSLAADPQGGYNPSADEDTKAVFATYVYYPAEEINVLGELGSNAADRYYIANHEQGMFTLSIDKPHYIDPSRCYIRSSYKNGWFPIFFTDLMRDFGSYIYVGHIDSISQTDRNFTDIQIYIDQEYNPDENCPDMTIKVFANPDEADSFCAEFGGSWSYLPGPVYPSPTPTPELPTPEPEDPTPEPGEPTPAPEDPDDPPKAGGASLIVLGIAAIASAAGMAGAAVLKKRR